MPSARASSDGTTGTLRRLCAVAAATLWGRFVDVVLPTSACSVGLNAGWLSSALLELDTESSKDALVDGPWLPYIASVAPQDGSVSCIVPTSCGVY
jgi:hypothetical protein